MKILIVGATGITGQRVASELAGQDPVSQVVLAARDARKLLRLATSLGGADRGISTTVLDALDQAALEDALTTCAAVVGSVSCHHDAAMGIARAALAAKVPAVLVSGITGEDAATLQGTTPVVTGCGLAPGIIDILAAAAGANMHAVDQVEAAVATSLRDVWGPPLMARLAASLSRPQGEVGQAGLAHPLVRLVYFPEPVGWSETVPVNGVVEQSLARLFPGSRPVVESRLGLTERAAMDAVRAAGRLARAVPPARALTRAFFLRALPPVAKVSASAGWTAARVDVRGARAGRSHVVSLGIVDRGSNLVALPLAWAAVEAASGRLRGAGLVGPAEALDAGSLFAYLERRGVRAARLRPAPL